MSRYDQLLHAIDLIKPQSIVEIGTWKGRSAVMMIKQAQKYRKNIQYIGYDLFEEATAETDAEELNIKQHNTVEAVEAYIMSECPDVQMNLIKGNTRKTLNNISADLCFIDGGHSLETIEHDYSKVKQSGLILLDDFYTPDDEGKCPDLGKYGCNMLVSELDGVVVLPMKNKVKTGGWTQMAMVLGVRA